MGPIRSWDGDHGRIAPGRVIRSPAPDPGYTLVVCEKPDAARRVAEALSDGTAHSFSDNGIEAFRVTRGGEDFVICSAQGHVYAIADPFKERAVYPVFDVEWYPSNLVEERNAKSAARIEVIRRLAQGAARFVNACDFDPEGETIGFNVLRYACGDKEDGAFRARFSTLTKDDVVAAFGLAKPQTGHRQARAGRARHFIDFAWGINLSRALSQAARSERRYSTISMGRVQGPTLAFLAEREAEIRSFVPVPYWKVSGVFEKKGTWFTAGYSKQRVGTRAEAERVRSDCKGKDAVVTKVSRREFEVPPPPCFSTGDLQKEAYRAHGFPPGRALQVAERLYLSALLSYPRTASQRLPPSINCRAILAGLARLNQYSEAAGDALKGPLSPSQGQRDDPAHPAIHPTGEVPRRRLSDPEAIIFDLVVRRFLASFGPSGRKEVITVELVVGEYGFMLSREKMLRQGWSGVYEKQVRRGNADVPEVAKGDRFGVAEVNIEEKLELGPPRYNQGTLLEKMERENIGTKATRADIISTLVDRGYVEGNSMKVTDLGLAIVAAMARHAPAILTTGLTREVERKIEEVEDGSEGDAALVRDTVRSIAEQLVGLRANENALGREIGAAHELTAAASRALGPCPVCKTGQLAVIRSRKTRKRFVGCSNYPNGCRASAPLPQRGTVKAGPKPCPECSWPLVTVTSGRRPWKFCVNPSCPTGRLTQR